MCWFAFSNLLQRDLNTIVQKWNTHYIRKSGEHVVGGIPNQMFFLPESFGFQDCGKTVTVEDLNHIEDINDISTDAIASNMCDSDLFDYLKYVVASKNLVWPPNNWDEAEFLFDSLIALCKQP